MELFGRLPGLVALARAGTSVFPHGQSLRTAFGALQRLTRLKLSW